MARNGWNGRTIMKSRIIVILLAVTMPLACYALGQAIFTEFTGIEIGTGPPLNPTEAKFNCPGGELTGELFPAPCTPGSRVHIRGLKFPYFVLTNDPRLYGYEEVTMDGNFDGWVPDLMGPGSGHMWGTIRIEVMAGSPQSWTPTGEIWEGTWTGTRTVTDGVAQSIIQAVAHGTGGSIEGLQAKWNVVLNPTTGEGQCEGRILAPGGK
jgi:hypothetical protein